MDYQTRFSKPVPVPDAAGEGSPTSGGNVISVAGKIGALDEENRTARIDLTVTAPDTEGKEQKVLMKAQALVKLA